ncbi:MAG TPA: cation:proton antiporter [Polyangiaceae bacterium]
MTALPILNELAIIAIIAVLVTVFLHRLRLPTVAGLLAAGALIGPFGFGLIGVADDIEAVAEVGVVLLLFTIGLEFSLTRLRRILRQVALGGVLQVSLTAVVVALIAMSVHVPSSTAVFYGFVFALSSTAIVLRALSERQELDAPHGRFIVGTLIFQDLCVVPMVLVVPLLSRDAGAESRALPILIALGKAAVVVAAILTLSRFVVPRVLRWVDASRSREVFLLAILAICIGTAWLTSLAGLSLALGAFLGGMVVADTEYGRRALGDVLPLRDVFVSVFFVSLGMLFDIAVVVARPGLVLVLLLGFLVLKAIVATGAAVVMRFPARVAWLSGVGLAQFGEFGFVLAQLGIDSKVVAPADIQPLLAAGIVSMFLTPLLVRAAPHITAGERLLAPLERLIGARSIDDVDAGRTTLRDHVIIVGYGIAGRFAAAALERCEVPYIALELNAETVRAARERSEPVFYADATSEEALGHAHLSTARALVLLINDSSAAQRVILTAQRVAPNVPILIRSRYLAERTALLALGARDVVAEEVEGTVEILSRLLRWLETPRNLIEDSIRDVRNETQSTERKLTLPRSALSDFSGLAELKIESVLIAPDSSAKGASPVSLRLRSRTGGLVVAVRRDRQLLSQPDPTVPFEVGDIVYLVGTSESIRNAVAVLVRGN